MEIDKGVLAMMELLQRRVLGEEWAERSQQGAKRRIVETDLRVASVRN